jgi:uncharacterized phage protein (TIGR01671 family)
MREIKFRAWYKKEQKMYPVTGTLYNLVYLEMEKGSTVSSSILLNIDISGVELLQYTGIKDCKGREIYEGDIVRVENAENRTVAYGLASFHLVSQSTGSRILLEDRSPELLEVIGNIYEHPHLLPEDSDK